MNKKKLIIFGAISIFLIALYMLVSFQLSSYYFKLSKKETTDEKILLLEKSVHLWKKSDNILALADSYISIGRNDLAEKIMVGRGEVEVLNKVGNLYLSQNKVNEAESAFTKAKNKKINPDSLKGLILVEAKYGDRGEAEKVLNQLKTIEQGSANCYASFVYLDNFKKAHSYYKNTQSCSIGGVNEYFKTYDEAQNPYYLRLEAISWYYSEDYLKLAESDILALIKEKSDYRDAYLLASKIYEKLENQQKADENKNKASGIDPFNKLEN